MGKRMKEKNEKMKKRKQGMIGGKRRMKGKGK